LKFDFSNLGHVMSEAGARANKQKLIKLDAIFINLALHSRVNLNT